MTFVSLDVRCAQSVESLWRRLSHPCDTLIFGVRLSLVWAGTKQATLATHLRLLLRGACLSGCRTVLHISSVAVANHVVAQHNVSEDEPLPLLSVYSSDYDRFKRLSEDLIDAECSAAVCSMSWSHLRISGIFSNDAACIQCTAVRNQALVSCYSRTCIDFNSSRNVAMAIALLVERLRAFITGRVGVQPPRRIYYYTRATPSPVPYGQHVADYRAAHGIVYGIWLPASLYLRFVALAHTICTWVPLELAASISYLLAVSIAEHTFDNSRFRADFPAIESKEESIRQAFCRIAQRQRQAAAARDLCGERTPLAWRTVAAVGLAAAGLLSLGIALGSKYM